jgi:phospholipid/cholesterol/gamma-HCH transport system substrate-binding protein
MLKYRGKHLIRRGFIGVTLIILVCIVGMSTQDIIDLGTSVRYRAQFTDAGGLTVGNPVSQSGAKIGTVSAIELDHGKAMVTFLVKGRYQFGAETTAHIQTGTLLGKRILTLRSAGEGSLRPGQTIPVTRTSTPYSLSDAVGELTTNTAGTDTQSLNQALDTLSDTIDRIAPDLGPAFEGLTRLSRTLNDRKEALRGVLTNTADVTAILAQRSQSVNTLILNANDLIGVLNERRMAIVDLLASTTAVARELSTLVAENEATLAPTLDRLNSVAEMLQSNRDNIAKALPGLAKYELTQGEAVASGYYYQAYEPNLSPGQMLQPFLDYAFGFRRGVGQGQPPDNAGPRSELPLPYNGIPLQGGTHP